ncbi:hypothetical protein O181_001903 [Austropuccinia psidii MF-1]|uniref:Uncharacterized protein n=1 Tax=Austropuccinia psidii MF-1 TaxID=1389203 RepID=A0A9Q3GC54_9BASI|nr:hypothetical protein [Austropuccinia psidii MF-1]
MSTPSQLICIGMIKICISINSNISLASVHSHLPSWIILWHNQHDILIYLQDQLNTIGTLPEPLSKTLIPYLGAPQTFMYCSPGGAWIENCQFKPTKALFFEGVLMTDQNEPSSSQ